MSNVSQTSLGAAGLQYAANTAVDEYQAPIAQPACDPNSDICFQRLPGYELYPVHPKIPMNTKFEGPFLNSVGTAMVLLFMSGWGILPAVFLAMIYFPGRWIYFHLGPGREKVRASEAYDADMGNYRDAVHRFEDKFGWSYPAYLEYLGQRERYIETHDPQQQTLTGSERARGLQKAHPELNLPAMTPDTLPKLLKPYLGQSEIW